MVPNVCLKGIGTNKVQSLDSALGRLGHNHGIVLALALLIYVVSGNENQT